MAGHQHSGRQRASSRERRRHRHRRSRGASPDTAATIPDVGTLEAAQQQLLWQRNSSATLRGGSPPPLRGASPPPPPLRGSSPPPPLPEEQVLEAGAEASDAAAWVAELGGDVERAVRPSDAALALCSLFANRWRTEGRWRSACHYFGVAHGELSIFHQAEDHRLGLRMVTFVTRPQQVEGQSAAAAVFAFRGTRMHKSGNVSADYQVLQDRAHHLLIVQRAAALITDACAALASASLSTRYALYATGHSLGGFTATACAVLLPELARAVSFEGPGLTTFYHGLAAQRGGGRYWERRVANYLSIPNPVNMCNKHLGAITRVHTKLHLRTDAFHVLKCMWGTGIRVLNWLILAHFLLRLCQMMCGLSANVWSCYIVGGAGVGEAAARLLAAGECSWELAVAPAHLVLSAYWTLKTASAYLAGRLGMSFTQLFETHSMWNIAQAFDFGTGLPRRAAAMRSWPRVERLSESVAEYLLRLLTESFFPTACAEGIKVMFDRTAMIEARVHALPGYVEAADDDGDDGSSSSSSSDDASAIWEVPNCSSFEDLGGLQADGCSVDGSFHGSFHGSSSDPYLQLAGGHLQPVAVAHGIL